MSCHNLKPDLPGMKYVPNGRALGKSLRLPLAVSLKSSPSLPPTTSPSYDPSLLGCVQVQGSGLTAGWAALLQAQDKA